MTAPVLVTGAGGFVGRHVVRILAARGTAVIATDSSADAIPPGASAIPGDLADPALRAAVLRSGVSAVIHLATVPGGAAEADPAASRRVNLDAGYDLILETAAASPGARFVFASSIAVFGEDWPALVDDSTPPAPRLVYGGHKAMFEQAIALFTARGAIDGISLRLPGVIARPPAPSGMKSAFLSNLFHDLRGGERFDCPVSPEATMWLQSLGQAAHNLVHALAVAANLLPRTRALTLPALRVRMADLASEVARQCRADPNSVTYTPDAALQAGFGNQPPLITPAADKAGFARDANLSALVESALATLGGAS